jgi:hypothetical protein
LQRRPDGATAPPVAKVGLVRVHYVPAARRGGPAGRRLSREVLAKKDSPAAPLRLRWLLTDPPRAPLLVRAARYPAAALPLPRPRDRVPPSAAVATRPAARSCSRPCARPSLRKSGTATTSDSMVRPCCAASTTPCRGAGTGDDAFAHERARRCPRPDRPDLLRAVRGVGSRGARDEQGRGRRGPGAPVVAGAKSGAGAGDAVIRGRV